MIRTSRLSGPVSVAVVFVSLTGSPGFALEGDPIFADGFELGDLCNWSSSMPPTGSTWFADDDHDGFGDALVSTIACNQPVGFVDNDEDCDDGSADTFPGAAPLDSPSLCLRDVDSDEFGDVMPPAGVGVGTDCDDGMFDVHPGLAEICNGIDDNCTDGIDEGFDLDNDGWTTCGGDCDDGAPGTHPGANDPVDGLFADENCDGIDGDLTDSVFVSPTGVDTGDCAMIGPCATVAFAMGRAVALGRHQVNLRAGNYLQIIEPLNGLEIVGGFDAAWVRADRTVSGHTATVTGGYFAGDDAYLTVRARSVSGTFLDLVLAGPNALSGGDTSQVVHAVQSALTFTRVTFAQGNGATGSGGAAGTPATQTAAPSGMDGESGEEVVVVCSTTRRAGGPAVTNASCANTGSGKGGSGGSTDTSCPGIGGTCSGSQCNPTAGLPGDPSPGGAGGGAGGAICTGTAPVSGTPGAVSNGAGGSGGTAGGLFDAASQWRARAGSSGSLGSAGTGGGGGGGAGGCDLGAFDDRGAGGGSGGAGGCRAPVAGTGGGGGGGSFGIVAVASSVTVNESTFLRGTGGTGGTGGAGAAGQPGGSPGQGGTASPDTLDGAAGGAGAHGGHSGGGGGGTGGRVCSTLALASTVSVGSSTHSGGNAGAGGSGGASPGNSGGSGAAGSLGSNCTCASSSNC